MNEAVAFLFGIEAKHSARHCQHSNACVDSRL